MGVDPWPAAPELPAPIIMDQRWLDAVFLHWRIPEAVAARFMPPGVAPDVFDGSAWVGLIGFRMQGAGVGRGPGIPYFGSFNEINVRLYSREPDGTRGVVFRSLDASRLAVVLAARAAGIPYVWSRASYVGADGFAGSASAGVFRAALSRRHPERFLGRPRARRRSHRRAVDPPHGPVRSAFTVQGRTIYVPNTHSAWPLYRAQLFGLEDQLVRAAGIEVDGPPESVLFSPGVHTQFGRPRVLHSTMLKPA